MFTAQHTGVSSVRLGKSLLVTVQGDLRTDTMSALRQQVLGPLELPHPPREVVVDLSAVSVIDRTEFEELRRVLAMCKLMGAVASLMGLQPGVVAFVVHAGVELQGLRITTQLGTAPAVQAGAM